MNKPPGYRYVRSRGYGDERVWDLYEVNENGRAVCRGRNRSEEDYRQWLGVSFPSTARSPYQLGA